ncbi:hypothetical protein L9F63_016552, partial [Diploptera punctata]
CFMTRAKDTCEYLMTRASMSYVTSSTSYVTYITCEYLTLDMPYDTCEYLVCYMLRSSNS